MRSYHISTAYSDRWGGDWPKEQFLRYGINIEPAAKTKHALYLDLLPCINSKRIDLLEHPKAFNQIIGLERRNPWAGHHRSRTRSARRPVKCIGGICSLAITHGVFDTTFSSLFVAAKHLLTATIRKNAKHWPTPSGGGPVTPPIC